MADTVDLNEITEYFDEPDVVRKKIAKLARYVRAAEHMTAFTGAGISTAANIPDYRGPNGVWTRKAQGRAGPKGIRMEQAMPTYAHMALVALQDAGTLAFLTSQNVDGLHLRSGIRSEQIAELHGNMYLEVCWGCEAKFLRTFDVSERVNGSGRCKECAKRVPHFCHCTSRKCTACRQVLKDSIIHFGENLPERDLEAAFDHARRSDLCLVLGSSLRVTPAADVPKTTMRRGGRLVIVNLQKTPLDDGAALIIRARIDDVMRLLAAELGLQVAPFELSRGIIAEAARLGIPPPESAVAAVAAEERAARARAAVAAAPLSVTLGNVCERVAAPDGSDKRWRRWTLSVEPSVPDTIASVRVGLHPTFSPAVLELSEPPFSITRTGWGVFDVDVTVRFRPELGFEDVVAVHTLSFKEGGAAAVIEATRVGAAPAGPSSAAAASDTSSSAPASISSTSSC